MGASIASLRGPPLNPAKKKETLNFRVSPEFKNRLIKEAGKEHRSLTNYLEITLTRLWDQLETSNITDERQEKLRASTGIKPGPRRVR